MVCPVCPLRFGMIRTDWWLIDRNLNSHTLCSGSHHFQAVIFLCLCSKTTAAQTESSSGSLIWLFSSFVRSSTSLTTDYRLPHSHPHYSLSLSSIVLGEYFRLGNLRSFHLSAQSERFTYLTCILQLCCHFFILHKKTSITVSLRGKFTNFIDPL